MTPRFDPTINLGHIISLGSIIVIVVGSLYLTDYRLKAVEESVRELKSVVVQAARTEQQIMDHSRRLDRLESR